MKATSEKRLMIVDDHPEVRRALRDLLSPLVSEICECTSGEDAIQHCTWFRPDFVTMDYQMGEMTGVEATRVLRALHPGAVIAMVTASDSAVLRREALRAQADALFAKDNLGLVRDFFRTLITEGGDNHA